MELGGNWIVATIIVEVATITSKVTIITSKVALIITKVATIHNKTPLNCENIKKTTISGRLFVIYVRVLPEFHL